MIYVLELFKHPLTLGAVWLAVNLKQNPAPADLVV